MKNLRKITLLVTIALGTQFNAQGQMALFENRITLITLSVQDMKISADFYQNVLGWQPADISAEGIIFYRLNGVTLALTPNDQLADDAQINPMGHGFSHFSIAYYTRSKEEVDQIMTLLKDKGVEIVKEASSTFWGGYRGYFLDPDGFLWEVIYNPLDPGWDVDCSEATKE